MKVVIASRNPAKVSAVREAFSLQFPGGDIEYFPVDVESEVSEQPMSDDETRRGARNRAINASAAVPSADFWVGMEGGVDTIDDDLTAFAWMAVLGRGGRIGEARTVTLPLPPSVKRLVEQGMELGDANDRVFSTRNSKHEGGAFGLLTRGLYTREMVYTEALVIALVPLVNHLY
jgi:inosine/xanthosine triphosphatase